MANLRPDPRKDNILVNHWLTEPGSAYVVTDNQGTVRPIQTPASWEYIATPRYSDDPNRIARSFRRPNGYRLDINYTTFTAGYSQERVKLYGGQVYRLRAQFVPHVANVNPSDTFNAYAVQWRFRLDAMDRDIRWSNYPDDNLDSLWSTTTAVRYNVRHEHVWYVKPERDIDAALTFELRSLWPMVGGIDIHSITCSPVEDIHEFTDTLVVPMADKDKPDDTDMVDKLRDMQGTVNTLDDTLYDLRTKLNQAEAWMNELKSIINAATHLLEKE